MLALPALVVLFILIVIFYHAIVKGWLFKSILLIGGSICMWLVLLAQPSCQTTAFTIGGVSISIAAAIPIGLLIAVLLTTKE